MGAHQTEERLDAKTRLDLANASLKELELAREKAELVPAGEVEAGLRNVFSGCRAKLLALPSRIKQAMPELTVENVAVIDRFVREALEELANVGRKWQASQK